MKTEKATKKDRLKPNQIAAAAMRAERERSKAAAAKADARAAAQAATKKNKQVAIDASEALKAVNAEGLAMHARHKEERKAHVAKLNAASEALRAAFG